jgi:hypothetical protein
MFALVERTLDRVCQKQRRSDLIELAEKCVLAVGAAPPIDRLARRHRPGLICWFCENWSAVSPFLLQQCGIAIAGDAAAGPVDASARADHPESSSVPEKSIYYHRSCLLFRPSAQGANKAEMRTATAEGQPASQGVLVGLLNVAVQIHQLWEGWSNLGFLTTVMPAR